MSKDRVGQEPLLNNYQQPPPPPQYNQQYVNPQQNVPGYYYPNNHPIYAQNNQYPAPINQQFPVLAYGLPMHKTMCVYCRRDTDSFPKKIPGGVTWMWCFGLFLFTGVFCCVPFCVDGCQDTQVVCVNCQGVKTTVEPNTCCWNDDSSKQSFWYVFSIVVNRFKDAVKIIDRDPSSLIRPILSASFSSPATLISSSGGSIVVCLIIANCPQAYSLFISILSTCFGTFPLIPHVCWAGQSTSSFVLLAIFRGIIELHRESISRSWLTFYLWNWGWSLWGKNERNCCLSRSLLCQAACGRAHMLIFPRSSAKQIL